MTAELQLLGCRSLNHAMKGSSEKGEAMVCSGSTCVSTHYSSVEVVLDECSFHSFATDVHETQ